MFGWLKKLFKRKNKEELFQDEWEWGDEVSTQLDRSRMNLSDPEQMERYVRSCCEQMKEAGDEIERTTTEYRIVTERLTDMEKIETLRDDVRAGLVACAKRILDVSKNRVIFEQRTGSMPNEQYLMMERNENDVPKAVEDMRENEDYKTLIKNDLQSLEGEKSSYRFIRHELYERENSSRTIAVFSIILVFLTLGILAVLQFNFRMDVKLGYLLVMAAGAVILTAMFIRYSTSLAERRVIEKKLNMAITAQNTVKIRYVNVTSLLEYLYSKFNVNNSLELQYLWEKYIIEKREREKLREANEMLEGSNKELVDILRAQDIAAPEIWLSQVEALVDKREMVEIRHHLIGRRQGLRKRIEYNEESRNAARDEVTELVKSYPSKAEIIMSIVDEYD